MSWVYVPQSSACSPATEGSSWASTELSEALARCVWSKGKPSPSQTWSRRCKRAPWLRLLSGLTCPPSTAEVGALMCSSGALRASPSPPLASVDTPTTSAGYGQMSLALSASAGPPSSSSKTCPASASEGSASCSETLPLWGTMRSGVVSQPPRRAPRTDAPGSSSWPTPAVSDCRSSGRHTTTTGVMHPGTSLTDAMRSHQDPTAPRAGDDGQGPMVLNPAFVEALMLGSAGIGHTEYACWATGCVQHRPPSPSES